MPDDVYLQFRDVRAEFPKLQQNTLKGWARLCPLLPDGRVVRTRPHPTNPPFLLYHMADVREACAKLLDVVLGDEHRDGGERWLWMKRVRSTGPTDNRRARRKAGIGGPYLMTLTSIYTWSTDPAGCPWLNGRPVVVRRFHSWTCIRGRDYVRVRDLDAVVAARKVDPTPPTATVGWVDKVTAERSVDRHFLIRFSASPFRFGPPEAHPVFATDALPRGREIQTDWRRVRGTDGRFHQRVFYWEADLKQILEYRPPPDVWATRLEAKLDYQLDDGDLANGEKLGVVTVVEFPRPPRHGQPVVVKHFRRTDLTAYVARQKARDDAGRPVPFSPERRHVDDAGRVYWPQTESERWAGVVSAYLTEYREKGCRHLPGGRCIDAKQVDFGWKWSEPLTWVYLQADCDLVWQAKHAAKGRRRTKPTGKREGRPSKFKAADLAKLHDDWKLSGRTMKDFATTVDLSYPELRARLNAYHAQRSAGGVPETRAGKRRQA